jgi:ketosteroid isomerase-like protein
MRKIIKPAMAALIMVSLALVLGARQGGAQKSGDLSKKLPELDRQWLTAAKGRDTNTLQHLFAEGFTEVHAGGEVVDKAGQIRQIKASNTQIREIHPDNIVVRHVSPDVAILTDTTTIKGASQGTYVTGTYRVLRVFVKQQGEWRAAGAGLTRLSADQK